MITTIETQFYLSFKRFKNLSVIHLAIEGDIEALVQRSMRLQCNISDGELTLMDDENSVVIKEEVWKEA